MLTRGHSSARSLDASQITIAMIEEPYTFSLPEKEELREEAMD